MEIPQQIRYVGRLLYFPLTEDPIIAIKALYVAIMAAAQNGSIGIFA